MIASAATQKEMKSAVMKMAQEAGWDTAHFSISNILDALLRNITDPGTGIDSGGDSESADLWFTVGGVEYFLNVRRSNSELAKAAQA